MENIKQQDKTDALGPRVIEQSSRSSNPITRLTGLLGPDEAAMIEAIVAFVFSRMLHGCPPGLRYDEPEMGGPFEAYNSELMASDRDHKTITRYREVLVANPDGLENYRPTARAVR
jgi:hypothetical protein